MTRQLVSLTLAAVLTVLSLFEVPTAQARQQCSAAMPSNPQGHWWSYRLIDGRKCWYEGKPGLSKSLLEWPKEVLAQPASGEEITGTVPEKSRNPLNSQAWAPNSQARAPTDPDTFEARWGAGEAIEARSPSEVTASVTWPATPGDNDGPPLKKADKLQSPFDSIQAKSIRTLAIIPDPPQPALRQK